MMNLIQTFQISKKFPTLMAIKLFKCLIIHQLNVDCLCKYKFKRKYH